MSHQDMINTIEQYLLHENQNGHGYSVINKEWVDILNECLRLLKKEVNKK